MDIVTAGLARPGPCRETAGEGGGGQWAEGEGEGVEGGPRELAIARRRGGGVRGLRYVPTRTTAFAIRRRADPRASRVNLVAGD